jgi:vacuolar protein sorting-associated protein 11
MLQNSQKSSATEKKVISEINEYIERYDSKVDKNYVLFLFKIYNYSDGVEGCCEKLGLRQELLSYFIEKKQADKILEICTRFTTASQGGARGAESGELAELWTQALTYFRDMEGGEEIGKVVAEKYLLESL